MQAAEAKHLISTSEEEEIGLIDLTSENQDMKARIAYLLSKLKTSDINEIEAQVTVLLKNMMNFFALHVKEIPSFESLTPAQQKALLLKFKSLAQNIVGREIKTVDEMAQLFVFTVLSAIGETVKGTEKLTAIEVMNKKHKYAFREFLKRAASYEFYKIINPKQLAGETKEENFISNAILLGVKKAMKYSGIEFNPKKVNHNSLKILEEAHNNLKKSQHGHGINR